MNQTLLSYFGTPFERVENALAALREGRGVMVLDDEDRENEGDMIFPAETMTVEQMALTIRHGSGIVCLCITEDRRKQLDLPMMVENNTSAYGTGFTVTIEAAEGVTTGVSAADRITTVRAAIADGAKHIFGSRFLPFVCCNDDAAALQTGFQELTERRIADRQPAAFTTQPFHAFFLRVLSAVQRNTHGKLAAHSRF